MNWQDSPKTSSISVAWGRQEGKEEVIRKAQPLHGKPNRAGHSPCDNYGYNQAWGIGNGPAYSSCPAKATTEPVKGKSMMMCFFLPVGWVTLVRLAVAVGKGQRGNLAFEGEVNEWTSLLRSIPVRPPGVCDVLPSVKLTHSPNITNIAWHQLWGEVGV